MNALSPSSSDLGNESQIQLLDKNPFEPTSNVTEGFVPDFLSRRLEGAVIQGTEKTEGPDYHINNKGEFILTRTLANNVGKVINPMSSRPVIQTNNILPNGINGYNITTATKNYVFNTRYRSDYFTSNPSECTFILPTKLKNVMSITLSALQYPNVTFAFDKDAGTNTLFITEILPDPFPPNRGLVQLPSGNYTIETFQPALENAINLAIQGFSDPSLNRFKVSNDPYTHFTTISNTTYPFTMDITFKSEAAAFGNCGENYYINSNIYNDRTDLKTNVTPADIYTSMGYLLGYRKPFYEGAQSYTSESQFNPVLTNYVYFCLDDYNKNNFTTTYGILPNSLVDENILGVVAITSPQFANTFDSGANFIYKTRHYTSPVDINRIKIKLLNTFGALVNLYDNDYAFCLEVEMLYDNLKPPSQTEVRITQ